MKKISLTFCKFLDKYKFFTNGTSNACYCFDPDKLILLLLKNSSDSELIDSSIKDQLFCASSNCYLSKIQNVPSPSFIITLPPNCTNPINICSQNLNIDQSNFGQSKVNFTCACSNCQPPKVCYPDFKSCLLPDDIKYFETKKSSNVLIRNISLIVISIGVLIFLGLIIFFYLFFKKKK
jgi:hypothetical protein